MTSKDAEMFLGLLSERNRAVLLQTSKMIDVSPINLIDYLLSKDLEAVMQIYSLKALKKDMENSGDK